jgi:tetratricopeptide (TPR) repeat protein
MNTLIFVLVTVAVFANSISFSQEVPIKYSQEEEKYMKAAEKYVEEKDYKNAISSIQYLRKQYPENWSTLFELESLGRLFFMDKQFDSSIVYLKSILTNYENQKVEDNVNRKFYVHTLHNLTEMLSDCYFNKKMYDSALYYFSLSDTLFPFKSYCADGYDTYWQHRRIKYSEIYKNLGDSKKETDFLLTTICSISRDTSETLTRLKLLLKDKKYLLRDLDIALSNIYIKTRKNNSDWYYYKFLDVEIAVPYGSTDDGKFDINKAVLDIKTSPFYTMIKSLSEN